MSLYGKCRPAVALAGLLAVAIVAVGCGSAPELKVLKIGVIGPESGQYTALGQAQHRAVQLAVDEINANGGAGDWQLEAVFEDDAGNPTKAASSAGKLISQAKTDLILGAVQSPATLAAMVITARAGVPQVTAGATATVVTEQGNKWLFRTALRENLEADAVVKYAKETLGLARVATLTAADEYGQSGARLLGAAAKQQGLQVVTGLTYAAGDKDYKSQLAAIRESDAQAIFLWGQPADTAIIARQIQAQRLNVQLFAPSLMASSLIELGGAAVDGLILSQTFLPEASGPRGQEFVAKYKARYGEVPSPLAAQTYDAVHIIADAVKRADSAAPSALRDALAKTAGLTLITGEPRFDASGDDTGKYLILATIRNGKIQPLVSSQKR
jgi:branched-chain amino acid transport system substrate-binding protein